MGEIKRIIGPVVHAEVEGRINDLVRVGVEGLLGEIMEIRQDTKIIQVYEETAGLKPGEKVENTGMPLSVELGPGLLGNVYDGTQRPLNVLKEKSNIIKPGETSSPLPSKKWEFKPYVNNGDVVEEGQIIGVVEENKTVTHKILVPIGMNGKIDGLKKGKYTVDEEIAKVNGNKIYLKQTWPVRKNRFFKQREKVSEALVSGQRILDFLYPIPKGGVAAIPGPFGAGKTVTQQQFAKWCDADIIVYIGCGERGNEMTEVLEEFPDLKDPRNGEPLMNRTVLIANTSNMPVAAREASIYTGITIAEYFRDQGYDVALMADSTSRWAEAMREISGRLEEMPGEEGFPAYLSKKLAGFYERAGRMKNLNDTYGSISLIGAVSPPGGDFSEPVTQNTLRTVRAFWALDAGLADKRHYPAINWLESYSLYNDIIDNYYSDSHSDWKELRIKMREILSEEAELQEIAQLVGEDSLPESQRRTLLVGRIIREDFLQQNAFADEDSYCSPEKMKYMAKIILTLYEKAEEKDVETNALQKASILEEISGLKYVENKDFTADFYKELEKKLDLSLKKSEAGESK